MISVTELRAGTTFLLDGQPYLVLKYEHSKIGRGTANIKVRVRSLLTGSVLEKTFISGAKVEPISVQKRKMQFLYQDGDSFYFMDSQSFDQVSIEVKILGSQARFLKEGEAVGLLFWEDRPLLLELPASLVFKVIKTGPGVKGDSATNIWKEAILENGIKLRVPLFIKEGDLVKIDTRSGEYLERISGPASKDR
jgi:elongation factor P